MAGAGDPRLLRNRRSPFFTLIKLICWPNLFLLTARKAASAQTFSIVSSQGQTYGFLVFPSLTLLPYLNRSYFLLLLNSIYLFMKDIER